MTLNLAPQLASALRREAAKEGLDTEGFIVSTLRDRLTPERAEALHSKAGETDLILEISRGFSAELWRRYADLKAKRQAGTLSSDEQLALIEMSDQIEEMNARRMKVVVELARRRQKTVSELMDELGIQSPPYE